MGICEEGKLGDGSLSCFGDRAVGSNGDMAGRFKDIVKEMLRLISEANVKYGEYKSLLNALEVKKNILDGIRNGI